MGGRKLKREGVIADINVKDVTPTNPNLSTNHHGSDLMESDNRYILLTIYSCFHY
jgi:hypothetical protein